MRKWTKILLKSKIDTILHLRKTRQIWVVVTLFKPYGKEVDEAKKITKKQSQSQRVRIWITCGVQLKTVLWDLGAKMQFIDRHPDDKRHFSQRGNQMNQNKIQHKTKSNFFHLVLNNNWAPGPKPASISRSFNTPQAMKKPFPH